MISFTIYWLSLSSLIVYLFQKLDDSHHDVRCSGLNLIGLLCPAEPIKMSSTRNVEPMELFSEFSSDQDPRVRTIVYQSLVCLFLKSDKARISCFNI